MSDESRLGLLYLTAFSCHALMIMSGMIVDELIEFSDWYRWSYLYVIPLFFAGLVLISVKRHLVKLKAAVWLLLFIVTLSIVHHLVILAALRIV